MAQQKKKKWSQTKVSKILKIKIVLLITKISIDKRKSK